MLLNFRQIQYIRNLDEKIGKSFKQVDNDSHEDEVVQRGFI